MTGQSEYVTVDFEPQSARETPHASSVLQSTLEQIVCDVRTILAVAVATGFVAGLISYFVIERYRAESAVTILQENPAVGSLGALSRTLGFPIPGASGASLEFYAEVARSPAVLDTLLLSVAHPWTTADGEVFPRLLEFLHPGDQEMPKRLHAGRRGLRNTIDVGGDPTTGILVFSYESRDPLIASLVVNLLVQEVSRFDVDYERQSALSELRFAEERAALAGDSLRAAEERLKSFVAANRSYQQSPELTLEFNRLERDVSLRNDLFVTLAQREEELRLRAARDVSPMAVLYTAEPPIEEIGPGARLHAILGMFVGGLIAVAWSVSRAARRQWPERFSFLRQLGRTLRSELSVRRHREP